MRYDYIIGGAGLAGLTLAWQMIENDLLKDKSLLIIDASKKDDNDRTWCFWSKPFEWINELPVDRSWNQAAVKGRDFDFSQKMNPYRYYKIKGLDYYQFILGKIRNCAKATIIQDNIISEDEIGKSVQCSEATYLYTSYFFKSYFYPHELKTLAQANKAFIWQHFYGLKIKVEKPMFDPDVFTYMDMQVPEISNGLSFAYILPDSKQEALVEYTLFSSELWEREQYHSALSHYIRNNLGIEQYKITEVEFNKIPMTNSIFVKRNKSVVPLGTLAGTVKASTGYSFFRNYLHIQKIIKNLQSGKDDFTVSGSRRFRFYDEVLMNVLATGKSKGHEVFGHLYKKNSLAQLLKFLNEETNVYEDIKIMNTVPKDSFIKAVYQELF